MRDATAAHSRRASLVAGRLHPSCVHLGGMITALLPVARSTVPSRASRSLSRGTTSATFTSSGARSTRRWRHSKPSRVASSMGGWSVLPRFRRAISTRSSTAFERSSNGARARECRDAAKRRAHTIGRRASRCWDVEGGAAPRCLRDHHGLSAQRTTSCGRDLLRHRSQPRSPLTARSHAVHRASEPRVGGDEGGVDKFMSLSGSCNTLQTRCLMLVPSASDVSCAGIREQLRAAARDR